MKTVGAYRSLWKRTLLRLFFPGYGRKGMGWLTNPKKALYNWFYYRTSISIPRLLGYKPSFGSAMAALFVASMFNLVALPVDTVQAASKSQKIKKNIKENKRSFGKSSDTKRTKLQYTTTKGNQSSGSTTKSTSKKATDNTLETTKLTKPLSATGTVSPTNSKTIANTKNHTTPQKSVSTKKHSNTKTYIDNETFDSSFENHLEPVKPLPTPQYNKDSSKSIPKNKADTYIQKRMLLEDVFNHIEKLSKGIYLDIEHDASANRIKLMYNGDTIGFLSKEDSFPVILCLRIGRKLYGVITDVKSDDKNTKIEVELWFSEGN